MNDETDDIFRREFFGRHTEAPFVKDIAPRPWSVKTTREQRAPHSQTYVVVDANGKWVAECGDPYIAHCIAGCGPGVDEREQRYAQRCVALVEDVASQRWDESPYIEARALVGKRPART